MRRRRLERELDHLPARVLPARLELRLDRPEPLEALADRLGGDEPAEPLTGGDQPVVADEFECAPDRDTARRELGGQLGLAGQQRTGGGGAHAGAELVGDVLIADAPHARAPASPSEASISSIRLPNGSSTWHRSVPGISSFHRTSSPVASTKPARSSTSKAGMGLSSRDELGLDPDVQLDRAGPEPGAAAGGEHRRFRHLVHPEDPGVEPRATSSPPTGMASCTWSMPIHLVFAAPMNLYYSCLHDRDCHHPDRTRRGRVLDSCPPTPSSAASGSVARSPSPRRS